MRNSINAVLIKELDEKGYRGQQIAEWLDIMHQDGATKDYLGFFEGSGVEAICFQMQPRWYLGGGAECARIYACPLVIVAAEYLTTDSVGAHPTWMVFEGIPPLAEVRQALDKQIKKLIDELPEGKVIKHQFKQELKIKGPGKDSPDRSEELTP